jgi:uncharacterized membrane protein YgcG
MIRRLLVVLALFSYFLTPPSLFAEERIALFDSRITVRPDASLLVTESITVQAEGAKISHGIFRDIPTRYRYLSGVRRVSELEVKEVMRDGHPESWFQRPMSNGIRIYMGQKDAMLDRGLHTYQITYTMDRQLGFFGDHDELYWNITGTGWAFPIEKAKASVHLPEGAVRSIQEAYTGRYGSRERAYETGRGEEGAVLFETTRPLKAGEGLTVVVGWQKGLVAEPAASDEAAYFIRDYGEILVALAGIAIVFLYYLVVWLLAGRDPEKGIIMPRYQPPWQLSPAAMRYIYNRSKFDDAVMASALVNLAVKGWIAISEQDGDYRITFNGRGMPVDSSERVLLTTLTKGSGQSIDLKSDNHSILGASRSAMKSLLKAEFGSRLFLNNLPYFVPGVVLSCLVVIAYIFSPFASRDAFIAGVALGIGMPFGLLILGVVAFTFLEPLIIFLSYLSRKFPLCRKVVKGAGFLLAAVTAVFCGVILFAIHVGFALLAVSLPVMGLVFYSLLKSPTRLGRKTIDAIEGFRMYLKTAEGDRLNRMVPPGRTPELFEKYLPYAMALGVEQEWAEHFEDVLSAAGHDPGRSLAWYSGGLRTLSPKKFSSELSVSLSSGIAAASISPVSGWSGGGGVRSGSSGGGGGSSGGGGGGGGGGGW